MNIRFDSRSIRVRMGLRELHGLCDDGTLCASFPLPQGAHMEWKLRLTDRVAPELARIDAAFELVVPRREILSLREKANAAQGKKELSLRLEISEVPVVLDVDYFDVSRRPAHG